MSEENIVEPAHLCDICCKEAPELCCFMCSGLSYHEKCWKEERHHTPGRQLIHESSPIAWLNRLRYINEPHMQTSIEYSKLQEDDKNCFIEFDVQYQHFQFGPRINSLLSGDNAQYPSFVSFIGRTANGKSFLIRALQHKYAADGQPTPIPAPGAEKNNYTSISGDIHLYADSATAADKSPILFLDSEGLEGSDVPRGLRRRMDGKSATERRTHVEFAYPRLIYTFSTCIVFVTSDPLAESADIKRRLISYASKGASGSKNQGFKPSLFLVFNRFRGGSHPDFDWSIESSSNAFLANGDVAELKNFYSTIRVAYIPSIDNTRPDIVLKQHDAFEMALREEHEKAFRRRQAFHHAFTSKPLIQILQRAMKLFSEGQKSVFDWSTEAAQVELDNNAPTMPLRDLWMQYVRYHSTPGIPTTPYDLAFTDFGKHIASCHRLQLSRNPKCGLHIADIPPNWAPQLKRLSDCIQCGASCPAGRKCEKVRLRHGEYHEYLSNEGCTRWPGRYEASQTFQKFFKAAFAGLTDSEMKANLEHLLPGTTEIRSVITCICCLQGPPSTILACGHAFCLDCIRELTELTNDHLLPHRCTVIQCPIHRELEPQLFSPRLLPIQSGYRILSLDAGGVKGFAQLVMLEAIERRCFGIPVLHLFDLVVGTSSGGQIALALTAPAPFEPLTVAATMEKFRELMKASFANTRSSWILALIRIWRISKYNLGRLASQLKDLFSEDTRLFSAATSSRSRVPNTAVTTVAEQSFQPYLIANYNRTLSRDAVPLLFGASPNDCMPVWAAARCTSATPLYFKPMEWQGKILLDGGLQHNCPAACAYSEAKSIWPGKPCDILLSLGTGTAQNSRPTSGPTWFRDFQNSPSIIGANVAWSTFVRSLEEKERIFRLNPENTVSEFELDNCQALDEISSQATCWLEAQNKELTDICGQLVAALFFLRPLGLNEDGVQQGEILCRLPADLEANRNLVRRMLQIQEDGLNLFEVDYGGRVQAHVNVVEALKTSRHNEELRFHVILPDLPASATGGTRIHVKMRNLVDQLAWLPISGSPYEAWSPGLEVDHTILKSPYQ